MYDFGYIAVSWPETFWRRWANRLPETWRYRQGPLFTGKLEGILCNDHRTGWGWQIPADYRRVWDEPRHYLIWQRLRDELLERRIQVIGIEVPEFLPSLEFNSPGTSDGKTLELIMFMYDFNRMLHQNVLSRNSEVMVIWEEGNLGLTCARLIARDVRFLTLVHPNLTVLEQAAAVVMAETGTSPKILDRLPSDFNRIALVIECGRLTTFKSGMDANETRVIKLFQKVPGWHPVFSISIIGCAGRLDDSPALAEALVRTAGGTDTECWCGSIVLLERVRRLAGLLKEFGIRVPMDNW